MRFEIIDVEKAHVIQCDHREAMGGRQPNTGVQVFFLIGTPRATDTQVVAVSEQGPPDIEDRRDAPVVSGEQGTSHIALSAHRNRNKPLVAAGEPFPFHLGNTEVLALTVASRHQAGQRVVAPEILHKQQQAVGVSGILGVPHQRIHTYDRFDAGRPCGTVELHHREKIGAIRQRYRRHPAFGRCLDQPIDADQAVDQRVFRVHTKVDEISAHGKPKALS